MTGSGIPEADKSPDSSSIIWQEELNQREAESAAVWAAADSLASPLPSAGMEVLYILFLNGSQACSCYVTVYQESFRSNCFLFSVLISLSVVTLMFGLFGVKAPKYSKYCVYLFSLLVFFLQKPDMFYVTLLLLMGWKLGTYGTVPPSQPSSVPHHTAQVKGLPSAGTHPHSARFKGPSSWRFETDCSEVTI